MGNPFKNTAVQASMNGKTFKVKTDANGIFIITAKASKVGNNTVTMGFKEDNYYKASNKTGTYKVNPANTKLTINKIADTKKGNNMTIKGTFKDQNNNKIVNSALKVNLNGKSFTVKTDNKTVFTIKTKANTIGTNNITVTYAGSSSYKTSTAKATFKVVKA